MKGLNNMNGKTGMRREMEEHLKKVILPFWEELADASEELERERKERERIERRAQQKARSKHHHRRR